MCSKKEVPLSVLPLNIHLYSIISKSILKIKVVRKILWIGGAAMTQRDQYCIRGCISASALRKTVPTVF